jgi:hypothetical protein
MPITKDEHLSYCRQRAMLEFDYYVSRGSFAVAVRHAKTSMLSDLSKHPDTRVSDTEAFELMMRPVYSREQMAQLLDNFDLGSEAEASR